MQNIVNNKANYLYEDLTKAFERLKEACLLSPTVIHQDATIQRFEFTYELSWKLMKAIAQLEGISVTSPKNAMRQAAALEIISDPAPWFEFLTARNYTVHTYKEEVAKYVYGKAKEFVDFVDKLLENSKKYLASVTK